MKNGSNYEYQYSITDHQGNTRVVFTSAAQTTQSVSAGFETANQTTEASNFSNYPSGSHINTVSTNAHAGSNSLYLNGGYSGQVGVAKSYKVYPGDQVSIQAYAKYNAPTGTPSNLNGFATALLNAFNLAAPAQGEVGTPSSGINTFGGIEAGGWGDGTTDQTDPKVFVTIVIFDKNYQFLDVAFSQLTSSGSMNASYRVKEAGYAFMYVSNEHPTQVDVYFDDITMSYTPSNIIQSNEYYAHSMPTANSWTRDNSTNNFLGNGGTELNATSALYDLQYRNYDAVLGRFHQVDPMTDQFSSHSPYNFAFNNPILLNDPKGDYPPSVTFEFIIYSNWDGGVSRPKGGDGGGALFADDRQMLADAAAVKNKQMSPEEYANKYAENENSWVVNNDGALSIYYDRSFWNAAPKGKDPKTFWAIKTEYVNQWMASGMDSEKCGDEETSQFMRDKDKIFNSASTVVGIYQAVIDLSLKYRPKNFTAEEWTKALRTGKAVTKALNVVGLAITYFDFKTSKEVSSAHIWDATFGVVGLLPGIGTIVSLSYFIPNAVSIMGTGQSLGQHFDAYLDQLAKEVVYEEMHGKK